MSIRIFLPGAALCRASALACRKASTWAELVSPSLYPSSSAILKPTTPGRSDIVASRSTPAWRSAGPARQRFTRSASSQTRNPLADAICTAVR